MIPMNQHKDHGNSEALTPLEKQKQENSPHSKLMTYVQAEIDHMYEEPLKINPHVLSGKSYPSFQMHIHTQLPWYHSYWVLKQSQY